MKTTIIFLGLAALSFTNVVANEIKPQDVMQQEVITNSIDSARQVSFLDTTKSVNKNLTYYFSDQAPEILNRNGELNTSNAKPITMAIAEDKLITESQPEEYSTLALEMSLEEKVAEDNQVIQSTIDTAFYPLDFKKINNVIHVTKYDNNVAIPVDIKL